MKHSNISDQPKLSVSASEVQKNFGRYHDMARQAPLNVTRHGQPSVVMLDAREYERLRAAAIDNWRSLAPTAEQVAANRARYNLDGRPERNAVEVGQAMKELREVVRSYAVPGKSVVDEFLAERRDDALNE